MLIVLRNADIEFMFYINPSNAVHVVVAVEIVNNGIGMMVKATCKNITRPHIVDNKSLTGGFNCIALNHILIK